MRTRKIFLSFFLTIVLLGVSVLALTSCKGDESNSTSNPSSSTGDINTGSGTGGVSTGTGGENTGTSTSTGSGNRPSIDNEMIYPATNLDDGKRREARGLRIYDNHHDVIYFGDVFTAEGYEVYMVYYEYDNIGVTGASVYSAVKLEHFTIDDSKVNYYKEGKYSVRITGRVRSDSAFSNIIIQVKADRYEGLGVKHLYGLKCASTVQGKVNMKLDDVKPMEVYAVYTENKYENGELVLTEERKRSGFIIIKDDVDVTKAGQYPVYIEYTEQYGEVSITMRTFFILVLEA